MTIAERTAQTEWKGTLGSGSGQVSPGSGAFEPLPVTWASRTEEPGGKTSPEELLAAAHSSCFAMALNLVLGERKTPAQQTSVTAKVSLDEVDGKPTVTTSAIAVRAVVPNVDQDSFAAAVDEAAGLCPVSRLFAGAEISVESTLEQGR